MGWATTYAVFWSRITIVVHGSASAWPTMMSDASSMTMVQVSSDVQLLKTVETSQMLHN